MKNILLLLTLISSALVTNSYSQTVLISGYVETDSGTSPKGVEIWNPTNTDIDFSVTPLVVDSSNTSSVELELNSGILPAGAVLVTGVGITNDVAACDNTVDVPDSFTFNGDDYIDVFLNGVLVDRFGDTTDPGNEWSGSGVSTRNQSLELNSGITTGNPSGFTDPSTRFQTVSTTPSSDATLAGFGIPPGGCVITTPITLSSFTAEIVDKSSVLEWTTLSEENNEIIEIQRSFNGTDWEKIGQINGQGTTDQIHSYRFIDYNVINGTTFYQLKQIDFDGSYTFSDIVSITTDELTDFEIGAMNKQSLNVTTSLEGEASYRIFNSMGEMVANGEFEANKGNQSIYYRTGELSSGFYVVQINIDGQRLTKKFLIP